MIQEINRFLAYAKNNPDKQGFIKFKDLYLTIITQQKDDLYEVVIYDQAGFVVTTEYLTKDNLKKGGYLDV